MTYVQQIVALSYCCYMLCKKFILTTQCTWHVEILLLVLALLGEGVGDPQAKRKVHPLCVSAKTQLHVNGEEKNR